MPTSRTCVVAVPFRTAHKNCCLPTLSRCSSGTASPPLPSVSLQQPNMFMGATKRGPRPSSLTPATGIKIRPLSGTSKGRSTNDQCRLVAHRVLFRRGDDRLASGADKKSRRRSWHRAAEYACARFGGKCRPQQDHRHDTPQNVMFCKRRATSGNFGISCKTFLLSEQ